MNENSRAVTRSLQRPAFEHVFALILAGGSGTRFWPVSRRARPKQLLKIFGKESLLRQAADRIRYLVPPERTYIFTSAAILDAVRRELPEVPRAQIVAEPASRNTAPAIGVAAHEIVSRDPEGVMMVLPSDHVITKPGVFRQALGCGCRLAVEDGRSVVIGIKPDRPETGYGYIRLGRRESETPTSSIFKVEGFTEKPALAVAQRYLRSGKYLWNAGMFIWKASTMIANLNRHQPVMAAALHRIAQSGGVGSPRTFGRLYPQLQNISVDYALMEKIRDVWAIAADIGWSDVGSWAAAYDLSRKDREGNVLPRSGYVLDARNNLIFSEGKFTAALGVEDLVIVNTSDALLVCSKKRSQDVGKIVRELGRRKILQLT